jgi:Rps23 Pro-64 3,4-dihydroxylase Tpa1-like proline 4-hydroxylase
VSTDELGEKWRAARPFAHVVIDDLVGAERLASLRAAVAAERHWPSQSELHQAMGSADTVEHADLHAFAADLGSPSALAAVRAISGRPVGRVEMRSYAYLAGHYLLPHTDGGASAGRLVAFAYYIFSDGVTGGELELFEARTDGNLIIESRPSLRIEPRADRLVLFDVGPATLHQVCEVTRGARLSLAGWFYA